MTLRDNSVLGQYRVDRRIHGGQGIVVGISQGTITISNG